MSADAPAVAAPAASPPRPAPAQVIGAFFMPLFFILMIAFTIVTAFHHSKPHDLALTISGSAATTQQIAAGIDKSSPGSFDITRGGTASEARTAVRHRETVGALVIGGTQGSPTVTVYTAGAGGRSAAAAVNALGTQIATQLGTTPTVTDLVPLPATDSLGTGLFYIFSYSSIAGYLTIVVLSQVIPRARLRTRLLAALIAAATVPGIALGLTSIFFDGFGASFGQIMAVLGIDGLYVFTVMLIAIFATQVLGKAAIFGIGPLAIFLNLPSAGGGSPESMLPGFWQALHSFWFGAGGYEAIRDVVYFPSANPLRWIVQLLVWTVVMLFVVVLIDAFKLIWRLQTIVLRSQHHADTMSEHLNLLSVPRQNEALREVTAGGSAVAAPDGAHLADQHPADEHRTDEHRAAEHRADGHVSGTDRIDDHDESNDLADSGSARAPR